jgi:tetratricopeptide (TPR) repeat protein
VSHVGAQVADALEYAAAQGVLHRDVKPSNLLLDLRGTVWLTDFGLAKASGAEDLTRTGDVVGTLRYMAPERFEGRADVRSDVYALGLTLYEMLALRPAFDAAGQAELMHQMTVSEPPRLERLDPPPPRDLVTVVHKAIARDPGDRYQTAGALADDLRRFLDDRSILARRVRLPEQAWRWCRRNPTMAGLLAALLALLLLATGGGVWLVQQRAERRAEARRQEEALRTEVRTAVTQAASLRKGFHFRQARDLLEPFRQRLTDAGPDDLRRQLDQALADLDLAERLDEARLRAATIGEGMAPDLAAGDRLYAATFAVAGLGQEGDDVEALAARVRDSAVREELVDALDDWASLTRSYRRREWLLAVARRADRHPARDRLRQPELWRDSARLTRLAQEVSLAEMSPQLATALGRVVLMGGGDAEPLLTAAQARFPNDFWLNYHLAGILYDAGQYDDAVGYYRAALAVRPEVALAHHNLGVALQARGQLDEAIDQHLQTLQLDPKDARTHINLGRALTAKGRPDEAIDHCEEALRLDPKLARAHVALGDALKAKGRLDEAIDHYQQAVRLDPKNASFHYSLGDALKAKGRPEEAIDHYRQAVRLDPKNASVHNNLGVALQARGRPEEAFDHFQQAARLDPKDASVHNNLGNALKAKGKLDEAIAEYQEVLRLDPKHVLAHHNLGNALQVRGRTDEAIDHYRQALRLDPGRALAHYNLGLALKAKGRLDEAIDHYRQAVRLDPKNAGFHNNLGNALSAKDELDEAIAEFEEVLRLDPGHALAHHNLGLALKARGKTDEAIDHYRQALRLNPRYANAHNALGVALQARGRTDEAIDHYQQALRLDPKHADAHNNLREALLQAGRFPEALAVTQRRLDQLSADNPQLADTLQQLKRCERLLALEARLPAFLEGKERPADAAEQRDLAALCRNSKRLNAAAARFYAAAFAARPELADDLRTQDRYNAACAAALAAAGQGADAEKLGDAERARLRRQAREWLKADLAAWAARIKDRPQERSRVRDTLRHWNADDDLAGVRDAEHLAKLPPEEQEACRTLWAEAEALLRQAEKE